jgi:hypothetical protein
MILFLLNLNGCAFMVAKETVKVIDTVLEGDPNPSKKEKILIKQNKMKQKAREFYCSKVEDPIKCEEL